MQDPILMLMRVRSLGETERLGYMLRTFQAARSAGREAGT